MTAHTGRFITLEGIDGAGKSTHVPWIAGRLEATGHPIVTTREPGGTPLGEALRSLILREPMTHDSEALLMFATRREHLDRVVQVQTVDCRVAEEGHLRSSEGGRDMPPGARAGGGSTLGPSGPYP